MKQVTNSKIYVHCRHALILSCLFLSTSACTPITPYQIPLSTQKIIQQAEKKHYIQRTFKTKEFDFVAWERVDQHRYEVVAEKDNRYWVTHVYLEGDGNSWKSKYQLSNNPTPKQPLALNLAMADPHYHVIYLARPCQYLLQADMRCHNKYWSSHRYGKVVMAGLQNVLNQITAQTQGKLALVGFSGGGTLATVAGAFRQDVVRITTVAGNLDPDALNQYHHVSPMKDTLNPMAYTQLLKDIPQYHYVGQNDEVVPPWVAQKYVSKLKGSCAYLEVVAQNGHHQGWTEHWAEIIGNQKPCPNWS